MEQSLYSKISKNKWLGVVMGVIILLSFGYIGYSFWLLENKYSSLEVQISVLNDGLSISQKKLTKIKSEYTAVLGSLATEQKNNALFEEQINTISSTVGVLEKLSKTDSELLKKYSKVYFLNENYTPPKLSPIPEKYLYSGSSNLQFHTDALPHLEKLMTHATTSSIDLKIISAYRSFGTQATLKSIYKVTFGTGTANKFSADQGYSEHQLGTTVDFTDTKTGTAFVGFEKTESYKWLLSNAHKYGFILSYPKTNTYYAFEPWHFRFVGVILATKLFEEGKNFYDLDQRLIDGYLINLFD